MNLLFITTWIILAILMWTTSGVEIYMKSRFFFVNENEYIDDIKVIVIILTFY